MIFVPWHSDAKTSQYQNVFACDRQCEGRWLLTRLLASTRTGHCMTPHDAVWQLWQGNDFSLPTLGRLNKLKMYWFLTKKDKTYQEINYLSCSDEVDMNPKARRLLLLPPLLLPLLQPLLLLLSCCLPVARVADKRWSPSCWVFLHQNHTVGRRHQTRHNSKDATIASWTEAMANSPCPPFMASVRISVPKEADHHNNWVFHCFPLFSWHVLYQSVFHEDLCRSLYVGLLRLLHVIVTPWPGSSRVTQIDSVWSLILGPMRPPQTFPRYPRQVKEMPE